jgi:hypothetical protein
LPKEIQVFYAVLFEIILEFLGGAVNDIIYPELQEVVKVLTESVFVLIKNYI